MGYVWWAVRGASIDEVFDLVLAPGGYARDPRWVSGYDLEEVPWALVTSGEWTLVLANRDTKNFANMIGEKLAAFGDVLRAEKTDFDWSIIEGTGSVEWSVYGSAEDDFMHPKGFVPSSAAIDALLDATESCEEVPLQIGELLTGFHVETTDPSDTLRIVRLDDRPIVIEAPDVALPAITVGVPEEHDEIGVTVTLTVEGVDHLGWRTVARGIDRLVLLVEDHVLALVDTSTFPPRVTPLAGDNCNAAAFAPWGALVLGFKIEQDTLVREDDGGRPQYIGLPFSVADLYGGMQGVAGGVVVVPATWADGDRRPCLIIAEGDERSTITIPVPLRTSQTDDSHVQAFGDGSFLIVWDGNAYRWNRGELASFGPLVVDGDQHDISTPAHDGSIVLLAENRVVQVWPDGRREQVGDFDDAQQVCLGLDDSIVLVNPTDEATIHILWRDRTVTAIADEVWNTGADVFYADAHARLLVAFTSDGLHAIPWSTIAAMPRTSLGPRLR